MAGESDVESWPEYRRLVLAELVRLNTSMELLDAKFDKREIEHHKDMATIQADVLALKIKAGMWGAVAGLIGSAVVSVVVTFIVAVLYHVHVAAPGG